MEDIESVNVLRCCGGHEDHIDSCRVLWVEGVDYTEDELKRYEEERRNILYAGW